jgi:hypothetical protein
MKAVKHQLQPSLLLDVLLLPAVSGLLLVGPPISSTSSNLTSSPHQTGHSPAGQDTTFCRCSSCAPELLLPELMQCCLDHDLQDTGAAAHQLQVTQRPSSDSQ